ncbi:hypothetical protein [Thioflexithrix psekupsensis]|uniref:Uncharacterized protein n=1 Tax=Thioflexithrix psekupsensis TaxID=1570016 RepID=A0A251XAJ1_9GAMM|nr:hypothetical protein [Thioflexithrix psekupsensis]OUD14542.1 hypothetical protein TPSD3_09625 [Thioflexithrix psekupsensis]
MTDFEFRVSILRRDALGTQNHASCVEKRLIEKRASSGVQFQVQVLDSSGGIVKRFLDARKMIASFTEKSDGVCDILY